MVKCDAPVGIDPQRIRVNAPAGLVALLLVQDANASCRTRVRTFSPDDANKKPQLMVEGLVLWLSVVHPSGLILNAFALMPLRA